MWREKRKVRIFGKGKCKLIANFSATMVTSLPFFSLSLSVSLSLSPSAPHTQYRKRFRASYNKTCCSSICAFIDDKSLCSHTFSFVYMCFFTCRVQQKALWLVKGLYTKVLFGRHNSIRVVEVKFSNAPFVQPVHRFLPLVISSWIEKLAFIHSGLEGSMLQISGEAGWWCSSCVYDNISSFKVVGSEDEKTCFKTSDKDGDMEGWETLRPEGTKRLSTFHIPVLVWCLKL